MEPVIESLLCGRQSILLRKGGILESDNQFELEHNQFLLFPTFIHQDPDSVKPAYRGGITQLRAEPEKITLTAWARVARIFEVPGRASMDRLDDLHIWNEKFLAMRFNYRPEKPLYLVLLQTFKLPAPIVIPNTLGYAGCKSWVPLQQAVPITESISLVPNSALQAIAQTIEHAFNS